MQDEKSGRAPAGPVSMAQVARVAGVSQQTVSRVANGLPNVSERTRERVLLAMEELGFRPNFAGRSLRSGRYNSVGLALYNVEQFGNLGTIKGVLSAAGDVGLRGVTTVRDGRPRPALPGRGHARMAGLPIDALVISMSLKSEDFEETLSRSRA